MNKRSPMTKLIASVTVISAMIAVVLTSCGATPSDVSSKDLYTTSTDLMEKSPEEMQEFLADKYIAFGAYPQQTETPTPIEWIVLTVNDNKEILLLSKNVLKVMPYSTKSEPVTWENSDLRAYLNDEFYADAGIDPRNFINELMKLGISGSFPTCGDDYFDSWIFNAVDETVEEYMTPGV